MGKTKVLACQVLPGDVTSYGRVISTAAEDHGKVHIVTEHGGTRSGMTIPATTEVTVW